MKRLVQQSVTHCWRVGLLLVILLGRSAVGDVVPIPSDVVPERIKRAKPRFRSSRVSGGDDCRRAAEENVQMTNWHCIFDGRIGIAGRLVSIALLTVAFCHAEFAMADDLLADKNSAGGTLTERESTLFFQDNCIDCHNADTQEGGLDLTKIKFDLSSPPNFQTWVEIHDRVDCGEMPPNGGLSETDRSSFVTYLRTNLTATDDNRIKRFGRSAVRRLNRFEFENTIRDLLDAPWLEVAQRLPEDGSQHGFNRSAGALDVSHIQLDRFLDAADYALREAAAYHRRKIAPTTERFYARDQLRFVSTMNLGGPPTRHPFPVLDGRADPKFEELCRELNTNRKRPGRHKEVLESPSTAERREREAIGVVVSTYEPTEIRFNNFAAPISGRYRLRLRAYSIWVGGKTEWVEADPKWGLMERARRTKPDFTQVLPGRRSEPVTLYSDTSPRILRKLGSLDVTPEPKTQEMEVWLLAGETIRPDAARLFRCRGAHPINPLAVENEGMPGVAFQWLEVEGPLPDEKGPKIDWEAIERGGNVDFESSIEAFLKFAYRRPHSEHDVGRFVGVADTLKRDGESDSEALLAAYKAILCSPEFLYLHEEPGRLNDAALASRLSYFLTHSAPDAKLRSLIDEGTLSEPRVLHEQTERLLSSDSSHRFVESFLDHWLDLRRIAATSPDGSLYPEYQLDDLLVESMKLETQAFFIELVRANLPSRTLISSDFAMLNERLAAHYGISGIDGVAIRRVSLPEASSRGGLMTQASVLKVTSDGTTTSPVLRGAWIAERLVGVKVPPPPENVPAVEPDTRGATTIREILDQHRSVESCAGCHRKIDPYGFALEAFDVMGAERKQYRAVGGTPLDGGGHNGRPFEFHFALPVKTDGMLPSGESFEGIRGLKRCLVENEQQVASNLLENLFVYATGAPIGFSDRDEIDQILERVSDNGYRVRDLIHAVVQSRLFQIM